MRAITSPRPVFIDVGANVGQHSLFMAAHGAQVHAFEPFALVRDQLQRQIEENQLDNITLHPLGLGNDNTRLPFYAPTGSNAGIGSFDADSTSKGNVRAGDLALAHGSKAVVLAGGLTGRMKDHPAFALFAERFAAKGRYRDLMMKMPIYYADHPEMGLFGAAAAAQVLVSD